MWAQEGETGEAKLATNSPHNPPILDDGASAHHQRANFYRRCRPQARQAPSQSQTGTEPEPAVVSESGAGGGIIQNAAFPSAWRAPIYE